MNKLPHPKNHLYDLYTGLCDYCGKPDMEPKLKKVRKSKYMKIKPEDIRGSYDITKEALERFRKELLKAKPTKSKEPRCTMTTSGRHIWRNKWNEEIDGIIAKCLACKMYRY